MQGAPRCEDLVHRSVYQRSWFDARYARIGPGCRPSSRSSSCRRTCSNRSSGSGKDDRIGFNEDCRFGRRSRSCLLNTSKNVYHCYGTRYYGTTKAGKYVSEADAKAAGAHADHGKACSQ